MAHCATPEQEDEAKKNYSNQFLNGFCLPFRTRNGNKFKIVQSKSQLAASVFCSRGNFGHLASNRARLRYAWWCSMFVMVVNLLGQCKLTFEEMYIMYPIYRIGKSGCQALDSLLSHRQASAALIQ